MRASLSTTSILDLNNSKRYINYVSAAGFRSMMLDLGVFLTKSDLEDYGPEKRTVDMDKLYKQLEALIEQCRKYSIHFDSIRVPHLWWNTKRTDLNELLLQIGKECIKICRRVNCRYVIVQPLFSGIMKADRWQENYRYYFELGKLAQTNNVCILLENQCDNINGHPVRGICADTYFTSMLIDGLNKKFNSEIFGFCLDTGACSLCRQDMRETAVEFGRRLKGVLIRKCAYDHEKSRLPSIGGSNMEWSALIRGLREIEYDGLFIMDVGDTLQEFSHLLRSQMYPMIKSVVDFLCWQVDMEQQLKKYSERVLFGAGKMCQNYMECYGQLYPPLYICDNNSHLWGAKVYNLDVKSPEALQKLPDNCSIIVCNVFYKEIAEQLRSMKIENPIVYFNDEFLPVSAEVECETLLP